MRKQQILQMLRDSDTFVSGEQISARLGVTRAAVWKAIQALRQEGYRIESVTRRGYRLTASTQQLNLPEICAALPEHPWRDRICVLPEIDSTNNAVKKLAAQGAPEGTVVIADRQSAGRGRLGRGFHSPAGQGLYLSVLLRPDARPEQILHLTAFAAVAVCEAIEQVCGVRPGIKWTNDLVLGTQKICGILTELSVEAESGRVQYVVIGAGTNCAQRPEDFPPELRQIAGSLAQKTGAPVDRNRLAAAQIACLHRMAQEFLQPARTRWLDQYRRDCVTVGNQVQFFRDGQLHSAFASGIGDDASLLVTYPDGRSEAIAFGEVSVRGMYGYSNEKMKK